MTWKWTADEFPEEPNVSVKGVKKYTYLHGQPLKPVQGESSTQSEARKKWVASNKAVGTKKVTGMRPGLGHITNGDSGGKSAAQRCCELDDRWNVKVRY